MTFSDIRIFTLKTMKTSITSSLQKPLLALVLLFSCLTTLLFAEANSFVWTPNTTIAPSWVEYQDVDQPSLFFAKEYFRITPIDTQHALALTIYFTETEGGFLRAYWGTWPSETALSENLYEGIAMPNQRTLIISADKLQQPGTLTFQSGSRNINIDRIHFRWVESRSIHLDSNINEPNFLDDSLKLFSQWDVEGNPPQTPEDQVQKDIILAPLITSPERIEDGVAFVFELEEQPSLARIEADFNGLPLFEETTVWVNNTLAGTLNSEVSRLSNLGYKGSTDEELTYTGWRHSTLLIPSNLLKKGSNELYFEWQSAEEEEEELETPQPPVAVKNLNLELQYFESTEGNIVGQGDDLTIEENTSTQTIDERLDYTLNNDIIRLLNIN